jgi:O-antigen/teichoic acid export membrane protein
MSLSTTSEAFRPRSLLQAARQRFADSRAEFGWVAAGECLGFLGAFAGVKLLTNALGTRGYGELAFGITIAGLLQMYVYSPLGQVVVRFVSVYRERGELPIYFYLLRRIHAIFGFGLVLLTLAASLAVYWHSGSQWALIVFFGAIYGIVSGFGISCNYFQAAIRQRKIVALHYAGDNWLRPLLAVVLLYAYRNSGYVALLGFAAATLLVDVSQIIFARRNREVTDNWHRCQTNRQEVRQHARELWTYGSPYVAWAGVSALSMFGDRWTTQYLFGAGALGIYAALYQVANAPVMLTAGVLNQFMMPLIFERAGTAADPRQTANARSLLYKSVSIFTVLMAFGMIGMVLFSGFIARLLTSAEIAQQHRLIWIMFPGIAIYQVGQQLASVGQIHRRTRAYIAAFVVNATATVTFSLVLGARIGLKGIAVALLISNVLYFLTVLIINRRTIAAEKTTTVLQQQSVTAGGG